MPLTDAKPKIDIGYLPEERGLYRNVKVLSNMMVYLGTLKGMSEGRCSKTTLASNCLERFESRTLMPDSKVSELSKGMQQKVQFAVTVLHTPELIIVDEPFSGLDPVNTLVIKDLILGLKDSGTAIIMSTHQMHQVEEIADRLLMLNRGKQALYGPVAEVRGQHARHAVIVEGKGDFAALRGVSQVEERCQYTQ